MLKGSKKAKKGEDGYVSDGVEDEVEDDDSRPMTAHEKIQVGRKKLPVYVYKEEFLAAVQTNKVLVIMAEVSNVYRLYTFLIAKIN
jgi:HrpA-like RNA helicase